MAKPILRVDDTKLQSWLRQESEREVESLQLFQSEGSALVMTEMRRQAPFRSGFLRESIVATMTPAGFSVYPTAPYARAVEEGVGPHMIFPVRAKALRFEVEEGVPIFAKYVQHPGFAGRFFVRRTAEAVRERLAELMREILRRVYGGE